MELFAALRFLDDLNLCGRVYWYVAPFLLREGDLVLAPVGPHDRLQCAQVELIADAAKEPYPRALCKQIASRFGDREIAKGCFDLGGLRYDDRHYTRLGRYFVSAEDIPFEGIKIAADGEDAANRAATSPTPVLIYGEGAREIGRLFLRIARGEEIGEMSPSAIAAVREKLC